MTNKRDLNATQSTPEFAMQLCDRFLPPNTGAKVLVLGSGTGSDVLGFLLSGVRVVTVEKDEFQLAVSIERFLRF